MSSEPTAAQDRPSDLDVIRKALDLMPWSGEGRRDAKAAAIQAIERLSGMERSETDSSGCVRATSAGDPQAAVAGGSSDPSISSAAYALLEQLDRVLAPLDSKIAFSLHVGTVGQMRADLAYLRGLLGEAHAEIKKVLDAEFKREDAEVRALAEEDDHAVA